MKSYKANCDGGCFSFGNDKFKVRIPNNYGDCEFEIRVYTKDEKRKEESYDREWVGVVEGSFDIYDYDCGEDNKVLVSLSGTYDIEVLSNFFRTPIIIFHER